MEDKEQKGIYQTGAGEIFWKNFLAGFSRALGGIVIYLVFLAVLSLIFLNFALPKIMPMISSYTNLLNSVSNTKPGSNPAFPPNLENLLGQ